MSRAKTFFALFVAMMAVGALASASASAEPPAGWMLNGKTLAEEGLNEAPVKEATITMKNFTLDGAGVNMTCKGVKIINGMIKEVNDFLAKRIEFTECVSNESVCTVPATVGTVPVLAEFTLDGALAVKGVFKPESGTVFTTLIVTGNECAARGNKPISGDVPVLAPEGKDERTDQLIETNVTAAEKLLLIGNTGVSLSGSTLVLLENNAAWSFL